MNKPMILVVGSGPYKTSTAVLLSKHGYRVTETIDITLSTVSNHFHIRPFFDPRRWNKPGITEITPTRVSNPFDPRTLIDARRWISKNSLRKLDGQSVKVICAMDAQGRYCGRWADVMSLIFTKHSPSVAAILQNSNIRSTNVHLNDFIFDLDNSIVLETMNDSCMPHLTRIINNLDLYKIMTGSTTEEVNEAWSSEKVILFGRTGSGKSTIAQMLTLGHLDPSSSILKTSSNARGMTKGVDRGEGRGWHVTDTPGFGEAKEGTVSTTDATDIVKKFLIDTCGIYSHFLYVVKKDRMNVYDEALWEFFKRVFVGAEENFSVVVTGCATKLSLEDENHLKITFSGCKNIIYVDFCSICSNDPELEEENKSEREKSLLELENGLSRLGIADKNCFLGSCSVERLEFFKSALRADASPTNGMGFALRENLVVKPASSLIRRIRHRKTGIDENIILLPQ